MIRLTAPAFLLLLGVIPWIWWGRGARHDRAARLWRSATIALVALSLSGPTVRLDGTPVSVVFVLDRSASMPASAQRAAIAHVNTLAEAMRPDDRVGLVTFGADAALERRPGPRVHVTELTSAVSPSASNIELALRAARLALGHNGARRIVLMSDGRETHGRAVREAALASREGVRIDAVAPVEPHPNERVLEVTRIVAPPHARHGEPFLVTVEMEGPAGASGELVVNRGDTASHTSPVTIANDGTASVGLSEERAEPGVYTFTARLRSTDPLGVGDSMAEMPEAGTMVAVSGQSTVLYAGTPGGSIAAALAASGFDVHTTLSARLPTAPSALMRYDVVVLDDQAVDLLDVRQAKALAEYVEQLGGGLLMLGGRDSLIAGGHMAGPLGDALPVDVRPRAGERAPSMALALVFDKSGSMADLVAGVQKIELARQAVLEVLKLVPRTDAIGVIAFDATPSVVAPLGAAPDVNAIADRLRDLKPSGSTAIAPAVALAIDWLKGPAAATAARRHILLMSDGRTSAADASRLRGLIANRGIELSLVATSPKPSDEGARGSLGEIARATGGRAYFPDDLRQLPAIVAREAARSAGGRVVEGRFRLVAGVHPVLAGIDRGTLPEMSGYVVSAAKPLAETILLSHLGDPVLAAWRFGLGKAAVFTADLGSPWSAGLRGWSASGALWAQTVRWLGRPSDGAAPGAPNTGRLHLSLADRGPVLILDAEHADGSFLSDLDVRATIRRPDGSAEDMIMEPVAPGRYERALALNSAGPYIVSVAARHRDGRGELNVLRGFYWAADQERLSRGTDMRRLAEITESTGGRVLGPTDNPFVEGRSADVPAWRWLAVAALLTFFADVALRRALRLEAPGTLWPFRRHPAAAGSPS